MKMKLEHDRHQLKDYGSINVDVDDYDDDDGGHSISRRNESFHDVLEKGVPTSNTSTHMKLRWLRSQIIGRAIEFATPFGLRRLTYTDQTASGRSLHYIEDYITTYVLPFYGNTHTSDSHVGSRTTKTVHEATQYIKKCLGGGEDDAIIFSGSGSTSAIQRLQEVMGLAIPSILRERMLKCLRKEERWVAFVGPYEHHSNLLTWRQSLAEVVEIGVDQAGLIDMEALREKLEFYKARKRPIIGSFSACSNVTGICTDTRAIASLLHRFGGFACFDFAASGPYAKIKMRSGEMDGYDAIFLSTHKFVGGPGTPGILVLSKSLYRLGSSPPSTCGGGTVDYVSAYNDNDTIYAEEIEEREEAGTPQIIQKIRAGLAFWIKEWIGYKEIKRMEKSYMTTILERLVHNPNICVLGNTTSTLKRQPIFSFLIYSTTTPTTTISSNKIDDNERGIDLWRETRGKPLHGPFVAKLLNDLFGIQARGGCSCAGPYGHILLDVDEPHSLAFKSVIQKGYVGIKPGWTRVSFAYYMSEEELEFILAAIEFIAIYGQRFLCCYHLNWKSGTWSFKKNTVLKEHYNKIDEINQANTKEDVLSRYTKYLETAKRIASLLPKFPPQRKIPQEIDIDLVPFRV